MSAYTPAAADVACANFALVVHIAKKFQNTGLPLDDLVGEGSVGLVRGLRSHNPALGTLSEHLSVSITHAIIDAVRRWKPWRQLPVDAEGEAVEPEDPLAEPVESGAEQADARAWVEQTMAVALTPREREAVSLRYLQGEHRTLEEVAGVMGVTRERVRQMVETAVAKLRYAAGQERVHGPPRTYRPPQAVAAAAAAGGEG
jgi:RNA polymerase sporulation-specific sigma factor